MPVKVYTSALPLTSMLPTPATARVWLGAGVASVIDPLEIDAIVDALYLIGTAAGIGVCVTRRLYAPAQHETVSEYLLPGVVPYGSTTVWLVRIPLNVSVKPLGSRSRRESPVVE